MAVPARCPLRKYVRHTGMCPHNVVRLLSRGDRKFTDYDWDLFNNGPGNRPCTCGLDNLLGGRRRGKTS